MRRRIVDVTDTVRAMRERFTDRPIERHWISNFNWPEALHNVGDSLAVAYTSDKWMQKNAAGSRELRDYKHLAESRNRVLVKPGLLRDFYRSSRPWPVIGPMVGLGADMPLPNSYAFLGLFEEANLQLYTEGTDEAPEFGAGDKGIVKVTVRHGLLGGSVIPWSVDGGKDETFIFVYTSSVELIVVGEKLAVEKDGIVG